jgi:hypothetical protein
MNLNTQLVRKIGAQSEVMISFNIMDFMSLTRKRTQNIRDRLKTLDQIGRSTGPNVKEIAQDVDLFKLRGYFLKKSDHQTSFYAGSVLQMNVR